MICYPRVPLNHPLVGLVFTPNMFVVLKCMDGLHSILNFKQFNCYKHVHTFKMPTISQVQLLIQQGDYAFSLDLKDTYLHILIVRHYHHFMVCLTTQTVSMEGFVLGFKHHSRSPYCSFAVTRVCILLYTCIIY